MRVDEPPHIFQTRLKTLFASTSCGAELVWYYYVREKWIEWLIYISMYV